MNYDTPLTAMVHNQRKGRIFRLGPTRDVDVVDLVSNTEFEQRARDGLHRKYDLRKIFVDPGESMDDTGLAGLDRPGARRAACARRQYGRDARRMRSTMPRTPASVRERTATLLADVETELRHTDTADDQIGEHAANAHDRLTAEIAKQVRRLEPEGHDPDADSQWRYLLGQRNRAQRVRALAEDAKSRR